jgi:nitrite reductase (NADH) large subunit
MSCDAIMSEPLIIVGNGMAAARLVDELAARGLGRYAIAVIGAEPRLAYNRVLLSSLLAGEATAPDIELKPAHWWRDRGVTLRYGCAATAVEPVARMISLADGKQLAFSKLVFATGSQPIRLPIPGMHLDGVFTFRDVGDVETIMTATRAAARVVVIGGGLLGLEAAHGLVKAGADVTLVHLMDRLMERQLDAGAAAMLKRVTEANGIRVLLEAETARVAGTNRVEAVELRDGRTIAADTVVAAVGIRPNAELARSAEIKVGRGIVVDDHLETSASGIYAIGECAEHRGICYGLVEPAYEQARILADHLCGKGETYSGSILATNLKVSGVQVFSAGDFDDRTGTERIVLADPGLGTYKKLLIADGRLVGAVLFGDAVDGLWYLELIRAGTPIAGFRDDLMFGRAFAERRAA